MTENTSAQTTSIPQKIPVFLNVGALALLAGLSFGVQLGLVPALRQMDAPTYLATMHGIIPAFTQAVVPLMVMGLISFIIRLVRRPACVNATRFLLAALAFYMAGAAITVFGHFPINHELMAVSVQNPPADWDTLRARWNELNFWRFAVAQLAFIATLVPLVFARNAGRKPAHNRSEQLSPAPGLA